MIDPKPWTPPFVATEWTVDHCPACGEFEVMVRQLATYIDGDEVEAYCADCHAELTVTAYVNVEFGEVEVAT